jgi:hypothetical protein
MIRIGMVALGIGNERKIGAIGKPSWMWDLRIVDEQDEDDAPDDQGFKVGS